MATFDHERMPVYALARQFNAGCTRLLSNVGAGRGNLADQLRRAAASVTLNLAEGAGEYAPREKARFYRLARRSGTECAAVLDTLVDTGLVEENSVCGLRDMAAQIVAMLVLLVKAVEKAERPARREPEGNTSKATGSKTARGGSRQQAVGRRP